VIERNKYLNLLISSKDNGFPKVITGIKRCGKSYLLNTIYKNYLLKEGVDKNNIINIDLIKISNAQFRDPINLYEHILNLVNKNDRMNYVFIDEIQEVFSIINPALCEEKHVVATNKDKNVIGFVDVVLDLSSLKKLIYILLEVIQKCYHQILLQSLEIKLLI